MARSFFRAFLTVLAALLLFLLLIAVCLTAGLRRQLSPDGTLDLSRRIDFYGAVAKGLSREGKTPEEWFTEQSDADLLPRISYTEKGLRAIADLPAFRSALRNKAEDYVGDLYGETGSGKMRTEEFLALADELYDDFVEHLDFHMLEEDRADLEEDLNERDLPQYDFSRLRDRFPLAVRAARFLLSDAGFYLLIGAAAVLALLLILLNLKHASVLLRSLGVPLLAAGLLLLLARGAAQLVMELYLNQWMGLGTILLQAFWLFFSTVFFGGIAAAGLGFVLCLCAGIVSAAKREKS